MTKPLIKFNITVTETQEDGTPLTTEFIDWFESSMEAAQETAEAFSEGAKIDVKVATE